MSIDNNAKAKISLKEGLIELEGSEEFVREQLEQYLELLKTSNKDMQDRNMTDLTKENELHVIPTSANNVDDRLVIHFGVNKEAINNLVHMEKDCFTIITIKIKGTKAEKQVNYCLLYCLTNEFYSKQTSSYKELRDLCEYFDCLDETNFASILTRNKSYFIIDGEKRSHNKNVKLTAPGKEEARKLISSLVGE